MTLRPCFRKAGTARCDSMWGSARKTRSASSLRRPGSRSLKTRDDSPRRCGKTLSSRSPASRSDVTTASWSFGCTQSRRRASAPMYPLAPATATRSIGLPLGVLELGPRARLAVLLALPHARIARQEPGPLKRRAQVDVELEQRAGNAVAHGPRLPCGAAAPHVDRGVEGTKRIRQLERLGDDHAQRLPRKVILEGAAVDQDPSPPGPEPHPRHRRLPPPRPVELRRCHSLSSQTC